MSEVSLSADLVDELEHKGAITAEDVLALRRGLFKDGVVDRQEAEAVFRLDQACATKAPEWTQFYVDALTDYFVWQSEPSGYVSEAQGRLLIDLITHDGRVDAMSELELLTNIVHWATACPDDLAVLALGAVRDSVLTPESASYGADRAPAVISPADVEVIRKIIYAGASGGGFMVTRREAEILFELNDATAAEENAPSWSDLFVKGIANHVMFPRGAQAVPDAEEAMRRDEWREERRGIGQLLGQIGRAAFSGNMDFKGARDQMDPTGRKADRAQQEGEDSQAREALARETIDAGEAEWLSGKIMRDGVLHENERKLLAFIKQNSPAVNPALDAVFAKAGI